MKPRFHKLPQTTNASFSINRSQEYHSGNEWHYHQELELIYIEEGEGTRFVSDRIEPIQRGELLLIGSNVPHMFRFNNQTFQNILMQQGVIQLKKRMLTMHFDTEIFGQQFLSLPENGLIVDLVKEASHGIQFFNEEKETIVNILQQLIGAPTEHRILLLMQLLTIMAKSTDRTQINKSNVTHTFNDHDENRLSKIYLYTLNNFTRTITLKNVSEIVYMDPNAFCRYFKSRTNKSYVTFLLEVRVSHACKLLAGNDFSMPVICYESGFKNISNFNRHFKRVTGKTPLEFRKKFNF